MRDIFCIIQYRVWVTSDRDYAVKEYAMLTLRKRCWEWTMKIIPVQKAKEIIDSNNMVEVVANQHGRVWELPDLSFKQKFRGKYRIIYD
jgi:hypothetical protein